MYTETDIKLEYDSFVGECESGVPLYTGNFGVRNSNRGRLLHLQETEQLIEALYV